MDFCPGRVRSLSLTKVGMVTENVRRPTILASAYRKRSHPTYIFAARGAEILGENVPPNLNPSNPEPFYESAQILIVNQTWYSHKSWKIRKNRVYNSKIWYFGFRVPYPPMGAKFGVQSTFATIGATWRSRGAENIKITSINRQYRLFAHTPVKRLSLTWQILGAIRAVATVWEAGKIFCPLNNARFHQFPVGRILWHLNTTTSIGVAVKTFGTEFWKFYRKGSFFQKTPKFLRNC